MREDALIVFFVHLRLHEVCEVVNVVVEVVMIVKLMRLLFLN